jgi:cytochrome c-type biogenesis protein
MTSTASIHKKVILNALAFILGFSIVFIIAGIFASSIGGFLKSFGDPIYRVIGIIIVVLGMNMSGFWKPRVLNMEARFHVQKGKLGLLSSMLIGAAFAFGWTPCVGPILGPILVMAGSGDRFHGALLLATYSAGLGVPFLLSAFSVNGLIAFSGKMKKHFGTFELVLGSLLMFIGIYLLIGGEHGVNVIRTYLENIFPTKDASQVVNYPIAFLAGLGSFITPCVLPLVPVYLSILAGVSFNELTAKPTPAQGKQVL